MTDPLREASSASVIAVRESLDPAQTPPHAALPDVALDVGAETPEATATARIPHADCPPVVLEIPSSHPEPSEPRRCPETPSKWFRPPARGHKRPWTNPPPPHSRPRKRPSTAPAAHHRDRRTSTPPAISLPKPCCLTRRDGPGPADVVQQHHTSLQKPLGLTGRHGEEKGRQPAVLCRLQATQRGDRKTHASYSSHRRPPRSTPWGTLVFHS